MHIYNIYIYIYTDVHKCLSIHFMFLQLCLSVFVCLLVSGFQKGRKTGRHRKTAMVKTVFTQFLLLFRLLR